MTIIWIVLVFASAYAGARLFKKLGVPAGMLIGALVFSAAFTLISGMRRMPGFAQPTIQALCGVFIGTRFSRKSLKSLKRMILPSIGIVTITMFAGVVFGIGLWSFTEADLVTTLYAVSPGGVMDMSLIAAGMGANTSIVSTISFIRLICVIVFTPQIVKLISRYKRRTAAAAGKKAGLKAASPVLSPAGLEADPSSLLSTVGLEVGTSPLSPAGLEADAPPPSPGDGQSALGEKTSNFFLVSIAGCIAAYVGSKTAFPSAIICFAMLTTIIISIIFGDTKCPRRIAGFFPVLSGIIIGTRVNPNDILQIRSLFFPALLTISLYLVLGAILAFIISKVWKTDQVTATLACAPGGLVDMPIIAETMGADTSFVAFCGTFRMICVVVFYPIIIQLILQFFR